MSFKDIKIIGVNENRTYKPDSEKLLYNVYFELSLVPSSKWGQIFEEEHRLSRHTMWRRACIDGRHIVVQCTLSEVEDVLRDIKQDVTITNQKCREYLQQQTIRQELEKKKS